MKDEKFDLALFGEGEGANEGSGCAAEQQLSDSCNGGDTPNDEACEADDSVKDGRGLPLSDVGEEIDAIKRIAFLLGLEGKDEESVVAELKARRARNLLTEKLKGRNAKRAYAQILSEAEALSEKIKGFDIKREIADRRFTAMIHAGLSVEDAWRALHVDDLINEAKEAAEKNAVSAAIEKIQLSMSRPDENGGLGKSPAHSTTSVDSLSGRGIREILRRVENGAKIKF